MFPQWLHARGSYQLPCCQYSTNCQVLMAIIHIVYVYGPCTSNEWRITMAATQYHHAWSHCAVFTTRGGLFSVSYTSSHDNVCMCCVYGPCTSNEWQITMAATQYHHAWSHCAVFTTRGGLFSVSYTSSHDNVCIQSIP